jgi:hypothetical protein
MVPHHGDSLVPQQRAAEATLKQALAEACLLKHPSRANTGELIRVQEVLQIAGDAAKRAITIRRRRRLDEVQRTEAAAMADAEATSSLGPRHRAFADAHGVTWDVFAVHPAPRAEPAATLRATFKHGWLCFESNAEKRRLSPIPGNWESLNDRELEQLWRQAELAATARRRRARDSEGTRAEDV